MELLTASPYFNLFLLSFLAATLIPLGSEWLLLALLIEGYPAPQLLTLATFGNLLGACTTYLVGRGGSDWLVTRVLRISPGQRQRAEGLYQRFGRWSLLLSWLPLIGDPICLAGGMLRVNFGSFLVLAGTGKFFRYLLIALAVQTGNHPI
ncbi:YqaA family protein [Desulfuromonas carbonis]|uniref:YqaA family protein n=1 Tax=Desulfuromonas sp. DDH964 TaxID=1823759 RepID=UPI00078CDCD8|nr:YqaA family protein [Desulfuromonas sp. DDH964]AMV72760.1 membrane protein YqaA [Desulfuromonas sp. DDH964]